MKKIILVISFLSIKDLHAQELFVFTEPASNMAVSNAGLRLNNSFMKESGTGKTAYGLAPEIMFGVSKKLMVHMETFFSNRDTKGLSFEGASVYGKYRFYSVNAVHRHFRMAAFGRYAFNSSIIRQEAIDLNGYNSGYQAGLVATKLQDKVALSAAVAFNHALDNGNSNKFLYGNAGRNAIAYTFSAGKLLLPKEYTNYRQTNLNAMIELLGQVNAGNHRGYLDIAPSLQVIINSVARIDIGEKIRVSGKLQRTAPQGLFIRLEYNFFNLFQK